VKKFGDKEKLLPHLWIRFSVDHEFHEKIVKAEKNYSEKYLARLLKDQAAELDEHPFYSPV
jgi:hypothetical protein